MEDDTSLVKAAQDGDSKAFGILYDRYIEKIYRFIYYKTFVKETAEDLTSDVFHKAFQKISSFDAEKGTFSAWIYRIARNAVIDHYRTAKKTIDIEDVFDLAEENRNEEEHDALLTLTRVKEYLNTLTPKQRELITLRIWEERPYKEIAEILGGSEDSVKMAFSRAIRDLREKCGPFALLMLVALLAESTLPFRELS
jgi:RNA polymerase sigma-70 factor (ECF subfamily)